MTVGEGEPMFMIGRTAILLDGYDWFGANGTGTCAEGAKSNPDVRGR